jgi:alpha-amylase
VANLPDIRTESTQNVDLLFLIEKWKKEGRYDTEIEELDAFFKRTGYPKNTTLLYHQMADRLYR